MPTADNRIVQMTFKNEQFERGVRESLHSLEELKKALNLDKSAESLSNLEKIANSFDISGIASGVDNIASRFTLLGNIGQEIFHRISRTAVDTMQNVMHTITSMPNAGMSKYEQKNKSVQMIKSAMPDKTIEEIEEVLGRLNEYTDLTSYDFSNMANSIGKFVSAGVDLDVAEKVMEGIANETASAGGEISAANIAMYNFSQALAAGSVKLMDWRSIQNQNLDTKEFKEEIIQTAIAMGKLGKVSDKVGYYVKGTGKNMQQVEVDYKSFASTLSSGWFDSDVMIEVFKKYADRESDVGKKGFEAAKVAITLTQAFDAVKDAISTGWMTSFGYLFGNLEEAGDLFTRVSDAIIGFVEQIYGARNALLKGWHEGGEDGISGYTKMIEGFSNVWSTLMGLVEAGKSAFKDVFGVLESSDLINITKAFSDFTGQMREMFGVTEKTVETTKLIETAYDPLEKWTHALKRGMKGYDIKMLQWRLLELKDTTLGLDQASADGIFGPKTEAALKKFQKNVGLAQTGVYDQATRDALSEKLFPGGRFHREYETETETVKKYGTYLEYVSRALRGVFTVGKSVVDVIGSGLTVAGKVIKVFEPMFKGSLTLVSGIGDVITYVMNLTSSLLNNESVMKKFDTFLKPISDVIGIIGYNIGIAGLGLTRFIDVLSKAGSLDAAGAMLKSLVTFEGNAPNNRIALFLYNLINNIRTAFQNAAPAFETLKTTVGNLFNILKNLVTGGILAGLDTIGKFLSNLFSAASQGDILTKVLNGIAKALQVVSMVIAGAGFGIYSLAQAAINGGIALLNFIRNSEFFKNALSSIVKIAKPVQEFFSSVFESLSSIVGKIGSFKTFRDVWTAFMLAMRNNQIGQKFVPVLLTAQRLIADFVAKIKNLPNTLRNAFEKAKSIFETAKGNIKGFFGNLIPSLKEFGQRISSAIGNFFAIDTSGIKGLPQKIFARLRAFEPVVDWIKEKIGGVKEFLSNPQGLFSTFSSSLQGFIGKIKSTVGGFFSNFLPNLNLGEKFDAIGNKIKGGFDLSGLKEIPSKLMGIFQSFNPVVDWLKTKFVTIKEFLMDPQKMLSHVVGALRGIGEFVINIFKNVNLGTIWDTAKTALGTYIMLSFANSIKTFSKSVGVLTGAVDKDDKEGFAGKLRNIAITIAIVTAALAGLAFIDAGQALAGIGAMAVAIGVVVGAIVLLNKFAPKTQKIGDGILSMALSIGAILLALVGAVALVNLGGDLTKPLLLVGGILIALGVVAWAMNKFGSKGKKGYSSGTAKTLLAMCAGIYLIVQAIGKMSDIIKANGMDRNGKSHQGRTVGALASVLVMLAALGAIAVLMSKFGGKGTSNNTGIASTILAICNSLNTIVSAAGRVLQLIKQYPDDWGWGIGIVEGLLVTMGSVAVLLAAFGSKLDFKVSLASAAPIVAMGFFLDKVVSVMADSIQKISGVNPKIIEDFLWGVGGAVVAMLVTVGAFSKIGVQGLIEASIGIVAVLTAIGLGLDIAATFAADAIDKMSTALYLIGSRLSDFSNFVDDIDMTKISQVMDLLINTILPTLGATAIFSGEAENAKSVALDILSFGESLGLFQRSIKDITAETGSAIKKLPEDIKATVDSINAIEGIDAAQDVLTNLGGALSLYYHNLAQMSGETPTDENGNFDINKANEAFGNLAELTLDDDTLNKIKSYATGGDHDLNSFAIGIENLATALETYGSKISTIKSDDVETANQVLDKVMDIDDHINPMNYVNFDVLKGKRQSISSFGTDVATLGDALAKYSDSISSLSPTKVVMANIVIDAVSKLANNLPTTGGLWQMLTGEQNLGSFATNMSDLGGGMANYANKVSDADFTNVDASTQAVKGLAEAQSILQSYGGLKSIIAGTAGLDKLGENLVGLGASLTTFAHAEGGIKTLKPADFENLTKIMEPIKALAEAQSILQRVGGWDETFSGKIDWSVLTNGLDDTFIQSLNQFNEAAKAFDPNNGHLMSVLDFIERLAFVQALSQSSQTGWDDLGHGFDSLMRFISRELGSEENGSTIETIQKNLENLFSAIGNSESQANLTASVGTASDAIQTAIYDEVVDPATTWGEDLVTNFATGMERNVSVAEKAALAIANIIWSYLHFTVPEEGPLADADTWGGDFLSGWVGSVVDALPVAKDAMANTATALADAFTGNTQEPADSFLGNLKTTAKNWFDKIVGEDIDNPVITPVLDLSNVESGASEINGMLSEQSLSVGSDLAKNVMNGNGVTIVQGGAAEDHSPEIITAINDLGNRIVELETQMATQMSNLKVVMNTNALVGQIAPTMDRVLGGYANRK